MKLPLCLKRKIVSQKLGKLLGFQRYYQELKIKNFLNVSLELNRTLINQDYHSFILVKKIVSR